MAGADFKLWFWPRRFKLDFLTVSVVVAGAYYSLSHCAAATGRLVPGSIPDRQKKEKIYFCRCCWWWHRPPDVGSNPARPLTVQAIQSVDLSHCAAATGRLVAGDYITPVPPQLRPISRLS